MPSARSETLDRDRMHRVLSGLGVLTALWIAVYWAWQPRPARISFDAMSLRPEGAESAERADAARERARAAAAAGDVGPRAVDAPASAGASESPGEATGRLAEAMSTAAARPVAAGESTVQTPGAAGGQAAPGGAVAGTVSEAPSPPRFREHVVVAGDRFDLIAQKAYGSAALWTAIARANPLVNPNRLKVGQVLRVPVDPNNIDGSGEPAAAVGDGGGSAGPGGGAGVRYTVRRGDTLSGISQAFYGTSRYAEALYRANRGVLAGPGELQVGQELLIPATPE